MAWASLGAIGNAQSKASSNNVQISVLVAIPVGSVVLVQTSWDNASTFDSSALASITVTDDMGNTYTRCGEYVDAEAGAGNGAHVGLFFSVLTKAMTSTSTITVTFSSAQVAKACSAWKFSIAAGASVRCPGWSAPVSSFGASFQNRVAFGNQMWVSVGQSGKLATAADPMGLWTQGASGFGATQIRGVAYGNGVWVIVGDAGKIATATDPTGTWTLGTSGFGATNVVDVKYGNGVWVIVGDAGKIATATDPTGTWTLGTSGFGASNISTVNYDGTTNWVIAGVGGLLSTATDPTSTWTARTSSFGATQINGVAFGNALWVAVGSSGKIATASDPTGTWTQRTSSYGSGVTILGVGYGNGMWIATGPTFATASDPTGTWTQRIGGITSVNFYSAAYDGSNQWVTVGDSGNLLAITTAEMGSMTGVRGDTNVDAGALAFSGLTSAERLYVRAIAGERAAATITQSTNFTVFTGVATSGGGAATNMGVCGEFRINTSTGEISDPTTAASDQASVFAVLLEVPAPVPYRNPMPPMIAQ